jgi:hypothetical protein
MTLIETRIGVLRALVERAAALGTLEAEICEVCLYRTFSPPLWNDAASGNMFCISGQHGRRSKGIRPLCTYT